MQKAKLDIKPFNRIMKAFFKSVFNSFKSFISSLGDYVQKDPSEFRKLTKRLFCYIKLLDQQRGLFNFFIKVAKVGQKDSVEMVMNMTSVFIKRLKEKAEVLKEQSSAIHGHLFLLKSLFSISEVAKHGLTDKTGKKLGGALKATMESAKRLYLIYCWNHVLGFEARKADYSRAAELCKA